MTDRSDPQGKRALFEAPPAEIDDPLEDDVLHDPERRDGQAALFSTGEHQSGTGMIDCSHCGTKTRASHVDIGVQNCPHLVVDSRQTLQPLDAVPELSTPVVVSRRVVGLAGPEKPLAIDDDPDVIARCDGPISVRERLSRIRHGRPSTSTISAIASIDAPTNDAATWSTATWVPTEVVSSVRSPARRRRPPLRGGQRFAAYRAPGRRRSRGRSPCPSHPRSGLRFRWRRCRFPYRPDCTVLAAIRGSERRPHQMVEPERRRYVLAAVLRAIDVTFDCDVLKMHQR